MKRVYLILTIIIVIEIIAFSFIIFIKNNVQNYETELVMSSDEIYSNETNTDETEKIITKLKQAKIEMEQREQELNIKREEILIKRKALYQKEMRASGGNTSTNIASNNSVTNSVTNSATNSVANSVANSVTNGSINSDVNDTKKYNIKVSEIIDRSREAINYTAKIEDLGIPLIKKYSSNTKAHIYSRNVWDMQAYNNRIYIGSGDYDLNTGPVDVYYYDIEKEEFVNEGSLPDEQINRFVVIDDQLIITGTDPREGWNLGNYFVWKDNAWMKKRVLPGGIHNFDLVKFHGKLFAGIGNDTDTSIVMSNDGGETFSYVYMYETKDKRLEFDSSVSGSKHRVYDLIEFKDKLYAFCDNKLYEYKEEENIFMKVSDKTISYGSAPGLYYVPLKTKLTYDERAVLVNGSIKYTEDLLNYTTLTFDKTTYVYDALVINGELHALCATPGKEGYVISVYKSRNLQDWEPVMYFEYKDFARSFEYANGCFYFGIGTKLQSTDDGTNSGRILKVKI